MFRRSFVLSARGRATTVVIATAGLIASGVVAAVPAVASTVWYVSGTNASDANTCLDPSTPCATVNGVLAKSGFTSGDTIDVAEGTYVQRPVFSTKGANVVGLGAGAIFDGANLGTASTVTVNGSITVGLSNLTLRNGKNTNAPYGGNLRIQLGSVNASNVTITGGSSMFGGGVAQYPGTTLTMNGGSISNNTAGNSGGAIYSNAATTTLTNVTVNQNTAAIVGGAVDLTTASAHLTMTGGTLDGNTALNGGGLYNVGSATFDGATVSDNTANGGATANAGNGGAIFNVGTLTITDGATLSGNRVVASTAASVATAWGGAIFSGPNTSGLHPSLTINNSTISGGAVTGNNAAVGGAIANTGNVFGVAGTSVQPSVLTATGLTVSQNTASAGGGIYNGGSATLTGSTLQSNQATSTSIGYGGGLYATPVPSSGPAPTTTIDSTSINSNTAGVTGGGLATFGAATTTIRNASAIDNNTASGTGGGLTNSSTMTITGSDVSNNSAGYQGGGLFNGNGANATVTGTTVDSNTAPNSGGGIITYTGGTLALSGGEISHNSAGGGGGLMVFDNGTATLDGTSLVDNTATTVGGGAIFNAGTTTASHVSITGNHGVHNSGNSGTGAGIYSGTSDNNVTIALRVTASTIANNDGFAGSALATNASGTGTTAKAVIDNSTITGNTNTSSAGALATINALTVTNSTITSNTAAGGAGALIAFSGGPISLAGNIIASNSGTECAAQSAGGVVDGGYNLTDSAARCGFGAADLIGSPQLGALADNGGPTQTQLPGAASAALDKIIANTTIGLNDPITGNPITLCATGATDQRGVARPQGAKCDIGSVEVPQVAATINGPSTTTFTVGSVGTSATFTSTGSPQPTFTESGTLPSGVTFKDNGDGTATISGTPNGPGGQFPVTVTASNEAGSQTMNFNLVLNQAPTLTGPSSATYTVGTTGAPQTFTQSGGYPVAVLSTTSTLPGGVTFTPANNGSGTLSGTATAGSGGVYPITITGDNGVAPAATWPFTLTVREAAHVSGPSSATFVAGTSGSSGTFTATGYPVPTLSATGLPSGLSMTSTGSGTAQISGTPAAGTGGSYNVTVSATNGVGTKGTTSVTVIVDEAPGVIGASTVRFVAGTAGSTVYATSGYPAPSLSESGALPSGVTFVDNGNGTATLAGTAATAAVGSYNLTITAHNGIGTDATSQVTLQVVPPLSVTTTTLGAGSYQTSYGATILATGGISPYSFAVTGGALPTGLSLATNGTISGVPTAMGTFNFTVTATDSNTTTDTATANLSITIGKGATTITMPATNGANINGTLTGGSPAIPIAGATIVFSAKGTNPPTTVCTAVTTSTGTFHCTMSVLNLTLATTKGGVTATYAGSTLWLGSTATAAIGP